MAEALSPAEVVTKYEQYKLHDSGVRGRGMATANHVTALTHECEAYAIYNRLVPANARKSLEPRLAMVFSEGRDQERIVKRDLMDAGFDVYEQQSQMVWPEFQIVGHQDFSIRQPGFGGVHVDVKSCAPFTFDSIDSVEDLLNHKWSFVRHWYSQLVLYMVLQNCETYWLMLKNKSTGKLKVIELRLNDDAYREAERMIAKAKRVNEAVAKGQEPELAQKITDPSVCSECEFFNVCLPDMGFKGKAVMLSAEEIGELESMLERRAELESAASEYDSVDKEIKETIKEVAGTESDVVLVGEWIASIKRTPVRPEAKPRSRYTKTVISFVKSEAPTK
jgi:CRISPR/Cas system-associated exonuclease Cas4 (RecB family)